MADTNSLYLLNLDNGSYSQVPANQFSLVFNDSGSAAYGIGLNVASGCNNSVLGGKCNTIETDNCTSTILGGQGNRIAPSIINVFGTPTIKDSSYSFIGAGWYNCIKNSPSTVVLAGANNYVSGTSNGLNSILGGCSNRIVGNQSTIAGGCGHWLGTTGQSYPFISNANTIGGGQYNCTFTLNPFDFASTNSIYKDRYTACVTNTTIAGGFKNCIAGNETFIGGGNSNAVWNSHSSVLGGCQNRITGCKSAILGGVDNRVAGHTSLIIGGECNAVGYRENTSWGGFLFNGDEPFGGNKDQFNTIANGCCNFIYSGCHNYIPLGICNVIKESDYAVILGGRKNIISNRHSGAVLITDGEDSSRTSTGPHTLNTFFKNGINFNTDSGVNINSFVRTTSINPQDTDLTYSLSALV